MNSKIPNAEFRMPNKGKVLRIIDANTNRAVEGLRVVEEICRFILEDKKFSAEIKKLRGKLRKIVKEPGKLLKARRANEDPGRKLYTKNEGKRDKLEDIFAANMKRVQEAVRCLEEFSKLLNPKHGKRFKKVRFQLYELEKRIALRLTRYSLLDFGLYVVTDPLRDHLEVAQKALAAGVKAIQLRDKTASKRQYFELARKISRLAKKHGVTFIVNDYPDIARRVDAAGVHLGQEDLAKLPIIKARKIMGQGKIIGVSTHSLAQAVKAEKAGADYISCGPIFKTPSKPQGKPLGVNVLRKVLQSVKLPVVAIGGIDPANVEKIKKTGCQRFAVIRAVLGHRNFRRAIKTLLCA